MSSVSTSERLTAVGKLVDACARSGRYVQSQISEIAKAIEQEVFVLYGKSKQYYEPTIDAKVFELRTSAPTTPQHNIPQYSKLLKGGNEIPTDPEFVQRSERYHTWMFSTYHSSLKSFATKDKSLRQLSAWNDNSARMMERLNYYLANPLRLPLTRQQLDDLVFIRNEMTRLITSFKQHQQQLQQQLGGSGHPSSFHSNVSSVERDVPISSSTRIAEEKIPSISPRRRLEEFMKSMQGVLSLLRPSIPLPNGMPLEDHTHSAQGDTKETQGTSQQGEAEIPVGVVPVGELVAELREHLYGISLLVTTHGPHPGLWTKPSDDIESDVPTPKVKVVWRSDGTTQRVTAAVATCFRCLKWVTSSLVPGVEPSKQHWLGLCGHLFLRCEALLEELEDGLGAIDNPSMYSSVRRRTNALSSSPDLTNTAKRTAGGQTQQSVDLSNKRQRQQNNSTKTIGNKILSHLELRFNGQAVLFDGHNAGGASKGMFCIQVAGTNKGSFLTIFFNTYRSVPVFATMSSDSKLPGETGSSLFAGTFLSNTKYQKICGDINKCLWKCTGQCHDFPTADDVMEEGVAINPSTMKTLEDAISLYLSSPVV